MRSKTEKGGNVRKGRDNLAKVRPEIGGEEGEACLLGNWKQERERDDAST